MELSLDSLTAIFHQRYLPLIKCSHQRSSSHVYDDRACKKKINYMLYRLTFSFFFSLQLFQKRDQILIQVSERTPDRRVSLYRLAALAHGFDLKPYSRWFQRVSHTQLKEHSYARCRPLSYSQIHCQGE